jgi:hypothetical protein
MLAACMPALKTGLLDAGCSHQPYVANNSASSGSPCRFLLSIRRNGKIPCVRSRGDCDRSPRQHALLVLVLVLAGFLPKRSGECSGSGSAAASMRARTFGVGEGGRNRDPRRRNRANPGVAAQRAGECARLAALCRGCRRICRLYRHAALGPRRRGLRRTGDACWQMVGRVTI